MADIKNNLLNVSYPQNAGIAAKSAGVMDYQAKVGTSDASKKVDQVKNCAIIVK